MNVSDYDSGLSTSSYSLDSSYMSELDSGLSLVNISDMEDIDEDSGQILCIQIFIVLYTEYSVYFIEINFYIAFIYLL
jgi:hypothetical protein